MFKVKIRDKGRKYLQLYYLDPFTGREISRSSRTDNHREAERAAMKWEQELESGVVDKQISWEVFREKVRGEYLANRPQTTVNGYNCALSTFEDIIGKPRWLNLITSETLSRFAAGMRSAKIPNSTAAKHVRHLRAVLKWAEKLGVINRAPAVTMPRVAEKSKGRPITVEEFDAMIAAIPANVESQPAAWEAFIRGLWLSGFRLQELMKLSWDSPPVRLRMDGKFPAIEWAAEGHKSGKVETSPITPDFAELIRSQTTTVGAVFPLPVATHFTVSDVIAKIGRAAGVKVSSSKFASAHDLRRSFASRWSLKVTPAVLRSLMRHASISTTMEFYVRHESDEIAAILQEFEGPKKSRK